MPSLVAKEPLDGSYAYDPARDQHCSTLLLGALAARAAGRDCKVLGVASVDLFIPIFTYVFGEAQLDGAAAVLSVARLRQSFWSLPEDRTLLYRRAEKEAIHEIGHTRGLVHCSNYSCAMRFSNSVEQVDAKGDRLCPGCAAEMAVARRRAAE